MTTHKPTWNQAGVMENEGYIRLLVRVDDRGDLVAKVE